MLDDASDPTNAVTNVKKLLSEHKVDALIGPTTTVFYDSGFLIGLKGFVAAVIAIALLIFLPQIVLFLPNLLFG